MTTESKENQTHVERLNRIAHRWTSPHDPTEQIPEQDVQELVQPICESLEEHLDRLVGESTFELPEAEVWALNEYRDEHGSGLTEDAVALVLATPDTGFGDTGDSSDDPKSHSFALAEIRHSLAVAKMKINDAQKTLGALTYPARYEALTTPTVVWLDHDTVQRLHRERSPDEDLDSVVTRILDEPGRSLEEVIRGYLDARGKDNVAQVAITTRSLQTGCLMITAHTAVQDDLPDIITETDAIIHHGHRYDFHFEEDPYGPHAFKRITLYASDDIHGMEEVPLEEGLAAANEYL